MRKRIRSGGQIMKKTRFIPLLLLCPLMFMGNSPAPYNVGDVYEDFEVSNIVYGEPNVDNRYPFSVDVKNTGTGYMCVGNSFYMEANNNDYSNCYHELVSYRNYADVCLGPGQTATLVSDNYVSTQHELSEYRVVAYGFKDFFETSFTSIDFNKKENVYGVDAAGYYFEIKNLKLDNDYYYSMIIDTTIKGENIAFKFYSATDEFNICLNDRTYVAEDFVFNNIYLIRGRSLVNDRVEELWILGYGITSGILFVGFLVSLAFIPMIVKSARKKAEEHKESDK